MQETKDFLNEQTPAAPSFFKKNLVIKIVAAIVGLFAVGTIILATRIWDPLWNPFRPEPKQIIESMYENMKGAESFNTKILLKVDDENNNSFSVRLTNDIDKSERKRYKGQIEISSVSEGSSFSFSIQYVLNDKELFIKMGNIPPIMGMDFSAFSGQWIKLEGQALKENKNVDLISEIKEVFVFDKELKDEKINGNKTYHYVIKLNKDKLEKLTAGLMESVPQGIAPIPDEETIGQQLEAIEDFGIDYFIGKRDMLLYKASFYKEIADEGGKRYLNFEWNFSDFNKEIHIDIPENAKPIEELVGGLFGEIMPISDGFTSGQEYSGSKEDKAISLMHDISFEIAGYDYDYGKEEFVEIIYRYNCQNEEIKTICQEIKSAIGAEPVINTSEEEYCMYIIFPKTEMMDTSQYYCIDTFGSYFWTDKPDCSETFFKCYK